MEFRHEGCLPPGDTRTGAPRTSPLRRPRITSGPSIERAGDLAAIVTNLQPGNYRGMVCAFTTAAEYQYRFGTILTRSNADCQ